MPDDGIEDGTICHHYAFHYVPDSKREVKFEICENITNISIVVEGRWDKVWSTGLTLTSTLRRHVTFLQASDTLQFDAIHHYKEFADIEFQNRG